MDSQYYSAINVTDDTGALDSTETLSVSDATPVTSCIIYEGEAMPVDQELVLTIYKGWGNVLSLLLTSGGQIVTDLAGETSVALVIPGQTMSSADLPSDIWWTDQVDIERDGQIDLAHVVKLRLGAHVTLPVGVYSGCRLLVSGAVWLDSFKVIVA